MNTMIQNDSSIPLLKNIGRKDADSFYVLDSTTEGL
jgi:hypothetical protein